MFGALILCFPLMVFVTLLFFVDTYTKHVWYYPLVVKYDVFLTFLHFQVLVERQFSWKIKSVQTDWGGEYRNLNSLFQTIGIHHRLICSHTNVQNDIIERRHQYIVEIGLALLGECSAPLWFWNYVF